MTVKLCLYITLVINDKQARKTILIEDSLPADIASHDTDLYKVK